MLVLGQAIQVTLHCKLSLAVLSTLSFIYDQLYLITVGHYALLEFLKDILMQ